MKQHILTLFLLFILFQLGFSQTLTLDSCKIYALENNKRLKEANMQLEISKQIKKNAFTNYFPNISGGAMAMKSNKALIEAEIPQMDLPVYDGNPANLAAPTQFTYFPVMQLELLDYANAGYLTAVQPVYAGGRIINGNKLASLGKECSEHNIKLTQDEVIVKTEEYYWTLVALNQKLVTLNSYKKLLESLLNDVTVSYEAGLIQKSDLLKVQLELNKVTVNELKLSNGIEVVKMLLAQHIGIDYSESISVEDTEIESLSPSKLFRDPYQALKNRNEYKMLNKAVTAENLKKKMARGEYLPQLAVGMTGMYLDVEDQQNSYGIAFATLSVPISGWWGGSYKIQEHNIRVNIAENNLDEKSELLLVQINKSYMDLLEAYEQIQVAESSVKQANEHLKVVRDNFDAGIVSTSDLLEAQALLQQTNNNYTDTKTNYMIKQAYYLQATANNNI